MAPFNIQPDIFQILKKVSDEIDDEIPEDEKITEQQAISLINTLKSRGFTDANISQSLKKYNATNAEELTRNQYAEILRKIK